MVMSPNYYFEGILYVRLQELGMQEESEEMINTTPPEQMEDPGQVQLDITYIPRCAGKIAF